MANEMTFSKRVDLLESAFERSFVENEENRRRRCREMFAISDQLERELTESKSPVLTHALASISDIQGMIEQLFAHGPDDKGTYEFKRACDKLKMDSPEFLR